MMDDETASLATLLGAAGEHADGYRPTTASPELYDAAVIARRQIDSLLARLRMKAGR